jgi:hypothetical protein
MSVTPPETVAEANRLYWDSDMPVAEIAGTLDISRRALYAAVEPLPAGRACPECGAELVFENRSGRTADQAVCLMCAADSDDGTDLPDEQSATAATGEPVGSAAAAENSSLFEHRLASPGAAAMAGAAIGAVFGAIVTFVLIPRR